MQISPNCRGFHEVGSKIMIDDDQARDGYYITQNGKEKYLVSVGEIVSKSYLKSYTLKNNDTVNMEQKLNDEFIVGDIVFQGDQVAQDGKYSFAGNYPSIHVKDGVIVKIGIKKSDLNALIYVLAIVLFGAAIVVMASI